MKAKLYIIAFVFLSLQIDLLAQEKTVNVELSASASRKLSTRFIGIVGTTDEGIYILRLKSKGYSISGGGLGKKGELFLDKYDHESNLIKSKEIKDIPITIVSKAKDKSYEFFYQDEKEGIWLFYSDELKGENRLFRKRLNQETLDFEEPILVANHLIMKKGLDRRSNYSIIQSKDNNKFAIYSFSGNTRSRDAHAYVEVFDNSMNSEWVINATIPEFNKSGFESKFTNLKVAGYHKEDILLSNDGRLNILNQVFVEKSWDEYEHILYSFHKGISEPVIHYLKNSDKYFVDLSLAHHKNGSIKIVGFYSNEKGLNPIDGLFVQSLAPLSLAVKAEEYIPFSEEDKVNFYFGGREKASKKVLDKIEKGKGFDLPSYLTINSIYTLENNSVTLCSEYLNSFQRKGVTYFGFYSMQFINISESGEINWIEKYTKKQIDRRTLSGSVYEMFEDDVIYFVYNDILNRDLLAGQINGNGESSSEVVLTSKKMGDLANFVIFPSNISKIADNQYMGVALRAFGQSLLKIEIE